MMTDEQTEILVKALTEIWAWNQQKDISNPANRMAGIARAALKEVGRYELPAETKSG